MRARPPALATRRNLSSQLALYLVFIALLWTTLTAISHKAPDLDGMEELVWAASFELGYLKHPPFPSWIMAILTSLVGRPIWLTFAAGMFSSVLGLWFIWKLACEFLSQRRAFMVVLISSVSIYFSLRGTIFNHNTAQLWSVTASIWLFYRATRGGRLSSWLWLGAVAALSTMTKYSALILFAAFFLYLLRSAAFTRKQTWQGLGLALLAYLLVLSPHLYWLIANDFAPFRYMDGSLETHTRWEAYKELLKFTLDQLARLSPMIVALIALHIWNRRSSHRVNYDPGADVRQARRYANAISPQDKQFLLWVGLTPFISTVLISAVLGTRLVASWATTFFVLYGFYALWIMYGRERIQLRRLAVIVIVLHILMAGGYALARGPLAWHAGRDSRATFPGPEISAQMQQVWDEHMPGIPLRVIVSDTWLGGNIAVHAGPQVQVYIDADPAASPWLNLPKDLDCGALIVYSLQTRGAPQPALAALYEQAPIKGLRAQRWSSERSPMIDLHWAILPARPSCAPDQAR
ncbi:glycosyltransferase family 39 protein [Alcaligenes sp. SDU_A2]|uniref:glycosyltransferase family 39 protein n=1 Tax=Alcaligenes sp. SDU_A2 TaxID=3136634 RepID=UPI00311F8446